MALAVRAIADGNLHYSAGQVIDVDAGFHLRSLWASGSPIAARVAKRVSCAFSPRLLKTNRFRSQLP